MTQNVRFLWDKNIWLSDLRAVWAQWRRTQQKNLRQVFGHKWNGNIKEVCQPAGTNLLGFGVQKMKTKAPAHISDAEVGWISAEISCQTLSKCMFSSLHLLWNEPYCMLCATQERRSCLCPVLSSSISQCVAGSGGWWRKRLMGKGRVWLWGFCYL